MYERIKIYRAKKLIDALSSESKLKILRRLLESPASATDLANEFGLTLPAITLHLKDLEEAGLIKTVEVRRGKGRPAKLYALTSKRISINIHLNELLGLPEEDLDSLAQEYVKRKIESGFSGISVTDIMETLLVDRATAAAISERLQSDPLPILEALGKKILESFEDRTTVTELTKKLRSDRYWILRALRNLEEMGLVKVKEGTVVRGEGSGGHGSLDDRSS
ncbi:MAG: helix-turn-helix domain-containing protein [Candidatus Korarchaeum sp.]|nr:helix-turn-helix domain-containing protein [Candidatus Korarchaeum sp.]